MINITWSDIVESLRDERDPAHREGIVDCVDEILQRLGREDKASLSEVMRAAGMMSNNHDESAQYVAVKELVTKVTRVFTGIPLLKLISPILRGQVVTRFAAY